MCKKPHNSSGGKFNAPSTYSDKNTNTESCIMKLVQNQIKSQTYNQIIESVHYRVLKPRLLQVFNRCVSGRIISLIISQIANPIKFQCTQINNTVKRQIRETV